MLVNLSKVRITFRIQKNRQNGQTITVVADPKNPAICPVRNAYMIYLRSIRLGQPDDLPMGVFTNAQGIKKYLTGSKIAEAKMLIPVRNSGIPWNLLQFCTSAAEMPFLDPSERQSEFRYRTYT